MRCCAISSSRKYTTPSCASMVCSYSCIVIASTTCIERATHLMSCFGFSLDIASHYAAAPFLSSSGNHSKRPWASGMGASQVCPPPVLLRLMLSACMARVWEAMQ